MANMQETTLSVPDVSCDHCVAAINGALRQQAGISRINVDLPTKTVSFTYDPDQIQLVKIAAILDDVGYTVAR
jgi:copper chaperone